MSEELGDQDFLSGAVGGAPEFAANIDPVLVSLLNEMEAISFTIDLTLTVHGFLISGTPVFMAEYLERQGALIEHPFRERANREHDQERAQGLLFLGEAIGDLYRRRAASFTSPDVSGGDADARARRDAARHEILATPRAHIMLKRVTIISPSGEQLDAPFWRGRLSHVAGWWVGRSEQHAYSGMDPDADEH